MGSREALLILRSTKSRAKRFLQCRICNLHASLAAGLGLLLLQLLLRLLLSLGLIGACEGLLLLNQSDLDVAGGGHVGVNPFVGPVGSPPHLGGAVHLDVLNDQVIGVKTLVLGVALGVLEHVQQELGGLDWPPSLGGAVDLVGLGVTANASHEAPEGNDFLLGDDVLEVLGGPVEGHGLDGLGRLPRVLEVNSQVGALGLSTLGGIVRLNCVTTHGSVSCRSESSNKSLGGPV